jgi:hypothetical protein
MVVNGNPVPAFRQMQRNAATDALGRAGDEYYPAVR